MTLNLFDPGDNVNNFRFDQVTIMIEIIIRYTDISVTVRIFVRMSHRVDHVVMTTSKPYFVNSQLNNDHVINWILSNIMCFGLFGMNATVMSPAGFIPLMYV